MRIEKNPLNIFYMLWDLFGEMNILKNKLKNRPIGKMNNSKTYINKQMRDHQSKNKTKKA